MVTANQQWGEIGLMFNLGSASNARQDYEKNYYSIEKSSGPTKLNTKIPANSLSRLDPTLQLDPIILNFNSI